MPRLLDNRPPPRPPSVDELLGFYESLYGDCEGWEKQAIAELMDTSRDVHDKAKRRLAGMQDAGLLEDPDVMRLAVDYSVAHQWVSTTLHFVLQTYVLDKPEEK